jgi:pSer/pThr/pTyr-binding forkhead associated (FHA) protein
MAETDDPTPVPASVDQSSSVESDQDDPIPPLPRDPRYSLAVIAGGQAGSVFQIHKPRIQLGRGSAMDIQLRDSEVSRRHALIEIRDPDVTLTDLDTTNGTWFNGSKIKTATINHQDEFTLGSTTLMLIVTPVQDVH